MPWLDGTNTSRTHAQMEIAFRAIVNADVTNALTVTQNGNASSSTSTGGAVNINNSGSTGAGLVVFSSQAAPAGRLLVARASSATFSQTVAYFETNGTGHAVHGNNLAGGGSNSTGSAGNFTSANAGASCVQISGVETGRGSLKITHTAAGGDANASGLSIDLQGAGTASKGIFVDSASNGTTGDLLDLRNNGNRHFTVRSRAGAFTTPEVVMGNGGPIWTYCTGTPEAQITAPVGSLCTRTDGGAATTLYVKESGSGNTGWAAK